jgi:hypothetical protein
MKPVSNRPCSVLKNDFRINPFPIFGITPFMAEHNGYHFSFFKADQVDL